MLCKLFIHSLISPFHHPTKFGARVKSYSNEDLEREETPLTEIVRDFLEPEAFYEVLKKRGIDFFTGVPDSLLKDFCAYVTDVTPPDRHIITVNEVIVHLVWMFMGPMRLWV